MTQSWGPGAGDQPMLDVASTARLVGSVLDALPLAVGLLRVGEGYPIVHCNAILDRWLPAAMHPVVGRRFVDVFDHASERERASAILDGVVSRQEPVHFRHYETVTTTSRGRDSTLPGGLQIWTWDVFPIRGHGGAVDYLLSVGLDVTDSALAERRLVDGHEAAVNALISVVDDAEARPDLEDFLGSLTGTVAGLVGAQRVVFFTSEGEVARARGHAHGLDAVDLALLQEVPCRAGASDLLSNVVHGGRPLRAGGQVPLAPGVPAPFPVHDCVAVPWRAGERPLGALVAFNSSSGRGFAEQAEWVMQASAIGAALVWRQRQAESELQARQRQEADALRMHAARMAELEKVKSDFLNFASHELRGPLAVVHGYMGLFLDGAFGRLEPGMAEAMQIAAAKLDEMRRLVDQLVEMARLEDERLELQRAESDLGALVHHAVETLLHLASASRRVAVLVPEHPVIAFIDADRMLAVVMNLVSNALKYSDGPVECRLEVRGSRATLAVTDHGPGISADDLPVLFTRFGRIVTPANRHVGGTGLGLYVSRELARRHGGDIVCRSTTGEGSTFTLVLPVTRAPAGVPAGL